MARSPEQTTQWVAEKIAKMKEVEDIKLTDPHTLKVVRKTYDPFVAGVVSVEKVTRSVIRPVLATSRTIEIVANVPAESFWTGAAIELAREHGSAFGGLRDLMSAVGKENVRSYIRREYEFVERGLRQHSKVSGLDRKYDRVYLVHRDGLPSLRFVMLDAYELTGDHIRSARDRYGHFDAVLLNNPNGRATSSAEDVADSMGVGVFKWGNFLSRLNRCE
jgi:hypothetical protein